VFDIVILAVLVLFAVRGFAHGFVREVFSVLGVVIAAILGFIFADAGAVVVEGMLGVSTPVARVLAFLVIFLTLSVGLYLIGSALSKLTKFALLKPLDKIGGALAGLLEGLIVIGVILAAMSSFVGIHKALQGSVVARTIADAFRAILSTLAA